MIQMIADISDDELRNLVDEDESMEHAEQFSEDEETSHIKKPKAYSHLTDAQYNRCKLREEFIKRVGSDKHFAVCYLRDNESRFRNAGFDDRAKQEMHRAIYVGGFGNLTVEDTRTLTSVFGSKQIARPTPENTQASCNDMSSHREPSTPTEWMTEMKFSTFPRFRKWMNQNERILNQLDEYGLDCLCDAFEYQMNTNYTLPFQEKEGFTEADMVWINRI